MVQKYGFAVVSGCSLLHHSSDKTQPCLYLTNGDYSKYTRLNHA